MQSTPSQAVGFCLSEPMEMVYKLLRINSPGRNAREAVRGFDIRVHAEMPGARPRSVLQAKVNEPAWVRLPFAGSRDGSRFRG
jgi:hypothetical protein